MKLVERGDTKLSDLVLAEEPGAFMEGVRLERVEQRRELRLALIRRTGLSRSGLIYKVA
jgi:hypothetical protein